VIDDATFLARPDRLAEPATSRRPRLGRRPTVLVAAAICLLVPATALALQLRRRPHSTRTSATTTPSSQTTRGVPQVGALFANATTNQHNCTAGVVDSPAGDMLITAAHCVVGSGAGMMFVPAFDVGRAPYGRWTITAAHFAAGWRTYHEPDEDLAFLTVAPRRIDGRTMTIQKVTRGYRLGSTATPGELITVTGYPAGAATAPITCTTQVYLTEGFPSFDCRGYVGGTSGTPWIHDTENGPEIVGIIGGLHQGGCFDYTSYSPLLARDAAREYQLAAADPPGDVDPGGSDDGCA
jgi:V8-like Glu-specific endopeptidase